MNYTKRKLVSVTRRIMNYYYLVHAPPIRWTCFRLIGGGRDNCRMRRNSIYSPCNRWIRSKKVRTLPDIYYRVPPYRAIWSNFSVAGCVFIFMKRFRERVFSAMCKIRRCHTQFPLNMEMRQRVYIPIYLPRHALKHPLHS